MLQFNRQATTPSQQSHLLHRFERPMAICAFALGLGLVSSSFSVAAEPIPLQSESTTEAIASVETESTFENGVYLYGQSQEPDQIGSEYLVFEVRDHQIIGAFYMPHSSFDCFSGTIETEQLALTIVDSYEQQEYAYAIALEETAAIASTDSSSVIPVGLEGYVRLDQISENDQQMLSTCQADLSEV